MIDKNILIGGIAMLILGLVAIAACIGGIYVYMGVK